MSPKAQDMSIYVTVDMSTKKKLFWCSCVLFVFLLWYSLFGGRIDGDQYAAMKQSMDEYESLDFLLNMWRGVDCISVLIGSAGTTAAIIFCSLVCFNIDHSLDQPIAIGSPSGSSLPMLESEALVGISGESRRYKQESQSLGASYATPTAEALAGIAPENGSLKREGRSGTTRPSPEAPSRMSHCGGQSWQDEDDNLRETREQILDRLRMCQRDCQHWDPDIPIIYAITPTYTRPVQKAELTRLSQTLMHVNNLHWIIVEDAPKKTTLVVNFLARSNLNYTHLQAQTPQQYRRKGQGEPRSIHRFDAGNPRGYQTVLKKARGVEQRNAALKWLRKNRNMNDKGVVYFADDDNTYSLQVFEEMRYTKEVSVWPVGLVGGLMVEKPVLNLTTGKVASWNSAWRPDRAFPIDMAGFAINLQLLLKKSSVFFSYSAPGGFLESTLLDKLTTKDHLEPKADNCSQVLVWHTRTENPRLHEERKINLKGIYSDVGMEV